MKPNKKQKEIIKYMKDNRKSSFIFDAAVQGMETYGLSLDVVLKHVLIYQFNLLATQKEILEVINVKN